MIAKLLTGTAMCAIMVVVGPRTAYGQEQDLRCDYTRKIECTAAGCQSSQIGSAYLLLPRISSLLTSTIRAENNADLPTIRRCDSKGCSPVVVRAEQSGAFTNIAQHGGAYFIKIATITVGEGLRAGDFVEVASQFLATITYFGACPAVAK